MDEVMERPVHTLEHTSDELKAFLRRVLQFNPHSRPSASELLRDPLFDKIRVPQLESDTGSTKIDLPLDDDRELPFDP